MRFATAVTTVASILLFSSATFADAFGDCGYKPDYVTVHSVSLAPVKVGTKACVYIDTDVLYHFLAR
ncbi:hypothetical protein BGX26_004618, partial [Mortierella sp. AD094]